MTRLAATTAAGFEHPARIHGKTGMHSADPSDPGPATGRSAWSWIIRHALCRYVSLDSGQWFPASTEPERARHEAAAAIAICHGCPVRAVPVDLASVLGHRPAGRVSGAVSGRSR